MNDFRQVHKAARGAAASACMFVLAAWAFLCAGCGDGMPADLMRVAAPDDPAAYVARLESERRDRGIWFSSSSQSPVPEPLRANWRGLDYYEVDPQLRFEGPLVKRTSGRTFQIVTTAGELRPCREVGYFLLDLGAGPERLPAYELLDQRATGEGPDLFIPFTDATTAGETYPAGRYLEVVPLERGQFLLDFNLAYNPSCAYGGSFQCPVAPEESRMRAAIRAGERGWEAEALGASGGAVD